MVGDSPCEGAGALLERDGFTGRACPQSEARSAFEELHPDCLVVCGGSIPTALAAAASEDGCPIVDCDDPPILTRNDDDEDAAGESALDDRVTRAVGGTPNRERIARLHEGSAELVGIEERGPLHRRVVGIAEDVLGFDTAALYIHEGDGFVPSAAIGDDRPDRLAPDHGMVSQVFETGEPALIDDIESHSIAEQQIERHRSGLVVPFGDDGVFAGLSTEFAAFDDVDMELAELLVTHGSQVDARLQAEGDLRDRQQRITRLHEAAPSLIDADSEAALFDRVVDITEGVLALDQSVLLMERDGELTPVGGRTDRVDEVSTDAGIVGRTYNEKRSFLVTDADTHEDAEPANESVKSAISIPVGDSGVFQVISDEKAAFDETDVELAELLIGYVEATLDRIRSEAALRESRQVIERLHTTAMELGTAETEPELLDNAADAAEDVLEMDMCKLDLRDGDVLVPVAESGNVPDDAGREMHVSEGLAGKTARTGESYLVVDLHGDADAEPTDPEFESAISVPIGDLGVFQAVATEPAAFDEEDLELAELLMAHVAVALQRLRAEAELRRERDSLEALFENIPGSAVAYEMIDGEPIVRRVNGAFERTFGYGADEIEGESLDEYIVPPESAEEAATFNEQLANGDRVQTEVERRTADGTKHFLLQVTPLEVGEENAPGYAIYSDVTEQRQREAELRRQNERLDQFASVVSHDLRNPLNVASGYLDLAKQTDDFDKLEQVEDALDRMDCLVTDLLSLAREGQDVGETQSIELSTIAWEAWAHTATGDASIDVVDDTTIDADPDRLVELFGNLYRNSVEHGSTSSRTESGDTADHGSANSRTASGATAEGAGDAPTVTVGTLATGEGFYVADDGPGIDDDIDPFDTGVTTSEEGTGFGLPIVESIAEAHGWSVSVTESEAGGARFEFETA
ncbi:PAS domain S-box-containing protein [Halolamina pelagica]|uniref:histidine kinase n=1 Tax=Halolamina pelagica TaxID=699431 RepID=A0A1I5RL96_9EURY|nr:PAS domain S-box-containing protein [Halolamina pelagica]